MDSYQVIRRPLVTEKGTRQKKEANQLAFEVDRYANKIMVSNAIESIFKVKVVSVRMMNVKGKERRVGRNVGKTADRKKAIVRLAPGQSIESFEGI